MKKQIRTFIVMLILPVFAFSQFTIKGKIFDQESSRPLPGAYVLLNGHFSGTISKSDGSYQLKILHAGTYQFSISYIGFKTLNKQIEINDDDTNVVITAKTSGIFICATNQPAKPVLSSPRMPGRVLDIRASEYVEPTSQGSTLPLMEFL